LRTPPLAAVLRICCVKFCCTIVASIERLFGWLMSSGSSSFGSSDAVSLTLR
jgi:hypothetical protein